MTTVQIVGIAVASLVVLILVIALLVTRRRDTSPKRVETPVGASFLDDAPQDTLSDLGRAEQPIEDVTIDPRVQRAASVVTPMATREAAAGGLGLDWGPDLNVVPAPPREGASHDRSEARSEPNTDDDSEITGELTAVQGDSGATIVAEPDIPPGSGAKMAATQPARPTEGESAVEDGTASESVDDSHLVPLSDIIVTTSSKLVDLRDEEVRRMLTDLVAYEIDQATEFRRRGQTIDAVLQLTEAEKASRALGMIESAARIRQMMEEIREGG